MTEPALPSVDLWTAGSRSTLEPSVVGTRATFTQRPRALPARQRVDFRTGLVLLVLSYSRGQTLGLTHVHALVWAMRSRRTRAMFRAWWEGRRFVGTVTYRLDPDLGLSLSLLTAEGLVSFVGTQGRRLTLTEKGRALAEDLRSGDLFAVEKDFLASFTSLNDAQMATRLNSQ